MWAVVYAFLLLLPACVSTSSCGMHGYPSSFINDGQTAATNLLYGSSLGYLIAGAGYGPVLAGCTPKTAVTGLQAPFLRFDLAYNTEGLLTAAISNSSEMGSYQVEYEAVPPQLVRFSGGTMRVSSVYIEGLDGERQNGTFYYEATMGRLSRVEWNQWNISGAAPSQAPLRMTRHQQWRHTRVGVASDSVAPRSAALDTVAAASYSPGPQAHPGSSADVVTATEGYEYNDASHPLMPTVYRSDGFLGVQVLGYSYRSDPTTRSVISIARSEFIASSACTPVCGPGGFCCASVGRPSGGAWCASKECAAMGDIFTYKYAAGGGMQQAVSVAIDGHHAQNFIYGTTGSITAIQQNITKGNVTKVVNMLSSMYHSDGSARGVIAFVIYPLIPMAFDFDAA